MARGNFINLLCRLVCLRCYGDENPPSSPLPIPNENRADENLPSDPPPPFPCGVHDGTATGSCTCGLETLGDGSVDFYKFEEELRALLKFPEQSDPDLVGKEKGITTDSIQEEEEESSDFRIGAGRIFSCEELQEAIHFFDPVRKLGDGGYGSVYLGKLKDGHLVAVKELHANDRVEVINFMGETDNFCNIQHQNLVTFYGCTSGNDDLLLVYEYVTNGNVSEHIHEHGEAGSKVLTWDLRIHIAIETAEALSFLHFRPGCAPIIHCDIKTDNILLDDNFHVKVCDFGLSSQISSSCGGTQGYLDPEFDKLGHLTVKSDVYSFGVVLLELISGKKAVDVYRDEIYLVSLALDMITNEQLEQLVDRNIGYQSDPEIRRMINLVADLACFCLSSEGNERPSMQEVVWKLKRIKDNKDHGIEHMDYFSPDQSPTRYTPDISNTVKFLRRETSWLYEQLSNSCGHKLSTLVLFYIFSEPEFHKPSCSCRLYLQDNRFLEGMARSPCFVCAISYYIVNLAALNEIPLQVAQRIFNYVVSLDADLPAENRQLHGHLGSGSEGTN